MYQSQMQDLRVINKMRWVQVNKIYPNMLKTGDGVFTDLQQFDVPWQDQNISSVLNYGYYLNSARKIVSPFVYDVADIQFGSFDPLSQAQRNIIASTIYLMFNDKWNRMWEIFNIEYNPLYNYILTEDESTTVEGSGTVDDTGTQTRVIDTDTSNTGTDTIVTDKDTTNTGTDAHAIIKSESDGGSETIEKNYTVTNTGTDTTVTDSETTNTGTVGTVASSDREDGIFGFNSSTAVGSDTSATDGTSTRTDNLAGTLDSTETNTKNLQEETDGTDTRTRSLTHTASNSDTETKNLASTEDTTQTETQNLASTVDTTDTRTDNLTRTTEEQSETTRSLSKAGNIGFNTPQEMLVADLELWQLNFFKSVFDDIDSVLTMSIY